MILHAGVGNCLGVSTFGILIVAKGETQVRLGDILRFLFCCSSAETQFWCLDKLFYKLGGFRVLSLWFKPFSRNIGRISIGLVGRVLSYSNFHVQGISDVGNV